MALEVTQSTPIFLTTSKASPIHLKILADTLRSQDVGKGTDLNLRKRNTNSNYARPQPPQSGSSETSSQLGLNLGQLETTDSQHK